MKYQKYTFGILFLVMFVVATPSFASPKTNNPVRNNSNTFTGIIKSINNDIYTIEVKKGGETSTVEVKFDANTRLSPRDRMNRDMMINSISPRVRHQNINNFRSISKKNNSVFKVGDTIQVMGKTSLDNTIQAQSMRKINLPKVVKNINN